MVRLVIGLLSALLASWLFSSGGAARPRAVTGTVVDWKADQLISVANDHTGQTRLRIALRHPAYEGDPRAIRPGARVTVWYKMVGERLPVGDRLQVLDPP